MAHHSFHVFVVYPWVRFLGRGDPTTPLHVLQSCRIRWGTVESVSAEFAQVRSRPLVYDGTLGFGDPVVETVRWRKGTSALVTAPSEGETVAAHWDWICGRLDGADVAALEARTRQMLEVVSRVGEDLGAARVCGQYPSSGCACKAGAAAASSASRSRFNGG